MTDWFEPAIAAGQIAGMSTNYRAPLIGQEVVVPIKALLATIRRAAVDSGNEALATACRAFWREIVGCRVDEARQRAEELLEAVRAAHQREERPA